MGMKHVLFGIFAHPDDEGFGPSGTLYKLAHSGTDVHLMCLTNGAAGTNNGNHKDLGAIRLLEWQKAGELIGARTMEHFGYQDGSLSNRVYLEIAEKVQTHIDHVLGSYEEPMEISFMTFDPNGLSGHIDHIVASLIATYVHCNLKQQPLKDATVGDLKYFCLSEKVAPVADCSWLYMPKGRPEAQIDECIDVGDVYDQKLEIMKAHATQADDMNMILERQGEHLKRECFWFAKD
jgi:LmbE family N-acetylglucosaminyl deacetylase